MTDLLLAGGEVVDAGAGLSGRLDVAVTGSVITAIGRDLDRAGAGRVVDVTGSLVAAGLVDLHTHVFAPGSALSIDPDVAGVLSGVTTVVDAGSSGPENFAEFAALLPGARTEVVPFVHIGRRGLAVKPDVTTADDLDPDGVRRVLSSSAGLVRGIKVRVVSPALQGPGLAMLRTARTVAREAGVPLMVHVGDIGGLAGPSVGPETLELLDAGDIVTHVFTANPGGVLDADGKLLPEARAAAERGVLFDSAHGCKNLSFDVARRVLDQGLPLHAVSTDLTLTGHGEIVFSLTEVMSRYLALGFDVPEVLTMATAGPAAAAGIADRAGRLAVGRPADLSVLSLASGDWSVSDSTGAALRLDRAFVPVLTVRAGAVVEPGEPPHPWGWEPTSVAASACC
ncbi:amidohydrolase family protein [Amycolatopsis sp. FDAARGOS 1241]|uniref:amidohydrolase family protein n=1 Tax=Amycolatopsis sp. FDAARGOS 1241 TaxID=2778070 RepID=UPI00194EAEEF|nr:amidohydrolase family protein [Amycolatopsis sp. FDAARGOS 1241]QRP43611.1 amidohydrolase family protein [Amycolatopsis sp. FDAARGOS 1241]